MGLEYAAGRGVNLRLPSYRVTGSFGSEVEPPNASEE